MDWLLKLSFPSVTPRNNATRGLTKEILPRRLGGSTDASQLYDENATTDPKIIRYKIPPYAAKGMVTNDGILSPIALPAAIWKGELISIAIPEEKKLDAGVGHTLRSRLPTAQEKEPVIRTKRARGLINKFVPEASFENIIKLTPMIPALTHK